MGIFSESLVNWQYIHDALFTEMTEQEFEDWVHEMLFDAFGG